jgi:hypothetical protein
MWPETAVESEALLSWITRTANENVLPSAYTILRRAGLTYTAAVKVALSEDRYAPALAVTLGADVEQVRAKQLLRTVDDGFVDLGGVVLREDSLATGTRRFSPSTLARNGMNSSQSMMRSLPYCAESWEYLQDSCTECGQLQRWRNARDLTRCDACCADLGAQPGVMVDPALHEPLRQLAKLAGSSSINRAAVAKSVPSWLRTLSPGELLETTFAISRIVDPSIPHGFPAATSIDAQERLARAAARSWLLLNDGEPRLLSSLIGAARSNRASHSRLAAVIRGQARVAMLPAVSEVLNRLFGNIDLDTRSTTQNLMVKPAARLLGVTEGEVADARNRAILATRLGMRRGRVLYNLDRNEVEGLAAIRQARVGAYTFASELGLPTYAVEQMISAGMIDAHDHPWLIDRYGTPQLTHTLLQDVRAELRRKSVRYTALDNPLHLRVALRTVGGGPRPWPTIIGWMRTGALGFSLVGDRLGMEDARISARDLQLLSTLPIGRSRPTYTQADALEILHLTCKHGAALKCFRIPTEGRNWIVDGEMIGRAARDHLTYRELCARTGLAPRTLRDALLRLGAAEPASLGWERSHVEALVADGSLPIDPAAVIAGIKSASLT